MARFGVLTNVSMGGTPLGYIQSITVKQTNPKDEVLDETGYVAVTQDLPYKRNFTITLAGNVVTGLTKSATVSVSNATDTIFNGDYIVSDFEVKEENKKHVNTVINAYQNEAKVVTP